MAASALVMGGLLGTLTGCGGGGGGSSTEEFRLRQVTGTVNAGQLGGNGPLRAVSPYDAGGGLTGDAFSVKASGSAAQLISVVDGDNVPRGMAISVPGTPTVIDAESTAAALVFFSPGLATTNPQQALALLETIEAHAAFDILLARAQAVLPVAGLVALRADPVAQDALGQIIDSLALSAPDRGTSSSNPAIAFSIAWGPGPGTTQQVKLQNGSYRYVRLDEVKLDKDRNRVGTPAAVKDTSGKEILAMPSATLLSVGSWGTGTIGSPATATGQTNLLQPLGGARYKMYVSGPGTGAVGEQGEFPRSWTDVQQAWQMTAIMLVAMPLVDIVMGAVGFSAKAAAKVAGFVGGFYSSYPTFLSSSAAYDAAGSGDLAGLASALVDAIVGFIGLGAFAVTVVVAGAGLLGFTIAGGAAAVAVATAVGLALGVVAAGMSARNLYVAGRKILSYPSVESVELPLASAEVIVK